MSGTSRVRDRNNASRIRRNRLRLRPRIESLEQRLQLSVSLPSISLGAGSRSILLLDPSGKDSLSATGNGLIRVTGFGSIGVDSSNPEDALISGNGQVSAASLFVDGTPGAVVSGQGKFTGTITPGAVPVSDPLSSLPPITTPPSKTFTNENIDGNTVITLNPGTYVGGIHISGPATVTLEPGIYYLKGGGFSVSGQATVVTGSVSSLDTGAGLLIYNASGNSPGDSISISGQASVKLTEPTTGTYQGISLFQAQAPRRRSLSLAAASSRLPGRCTPPLRQSRLLATAS